MEVKVITKTMATTFNLIHVTPPGHVLTYEYDYFVWIYSHDFKEIFGETRKTARGKKNYVKIINKNKVIYREIESTGYKGLGRSDIGLSYNSICDLGLDPKNTTDSKVKVCPISTFMYMLHHPNRAQSLPIWISVISLIIGLISLFFAL